MTAPRLTILRMADQIAAALVEDGLTQAEFAKRIGMTEKHVSRVLTGQNGAAIATLDYWAFVLGRSWKITLERDSE